MNSSERYTVVCSMYVYSWAQVSPFFHQIARVTQTTASSRATAERGKEKDNNLRDVETGREIRVYLYEKKTPRIRETDFLPN